ncbi:MAG TPA: helix-turn-helix domain-containing protein [Reyranella sp.]
MISETFATHSLPAADQFDAWRSWYGTVFDSTPRLPVEEGFCARASTWVLDGFTFSQVSAPAVNGHRSKAHIRRNPVDHWVLTSYRRGQTTIGLDSASLETRLGTPFVVSLGDEVKTERSSGSDRVALHLSRDRFQPVAMILDAARGQSLNTPQGKLLADYMLLLEQNLPNLKPEIAPHLRDAVQSMIEACLVPSRDRLANASNQINVTLMERVRRAVIKHLRSPSLGSVQLCREAATSRSQLYRLLEHEGGVVRYIQRRRLAEAFALLRDTAVTLSINKIAEALCFYDASGFTRAFRREFGMTPSDVRAAAFCGLHPTSSIVTGGRDVRSFADCLRAS